MQRSDVTAKGPLSELGLQSRMGYICGESREIKVFRFWARYRETKVFRFWVAQIFLPDYADERCNGKGTIVRVGIAVKNGVDLRRESGNKSFSIPGDV